MRSKIVTTMVVVGIFSILWFLVFPYLVTTSRVQDAAGIAKHRDLPNGYCFDDVHDWWGGSICIKREKNEKHTAILYVATAPGRDGRYKTPDDYRSAAVDFNKSKIIGTCLGNRARQFKEGVIEGLKTPNRHDK